MSKDYDEQLMRESGFYSGSCDICGVSLWIKNWHEGETICDHCEKEGEE